MENLKYEFDHPESSYMKFGLTKHEQPKLSVDIGREELLILDGESLDELIQILLDWRKIIK